MRAVSPRGLPRSCTASLLSLPSLRYAHSPVHLRLGRDRPSDPACAADGRHRAALRPDPGRYTTGRVFRTLGDWITRVNPRWRVRISGNLPKDPRRPFVVVSNHQSNADIPAISRLPWEMKWVAKKALFDVPVVGWMMTIAGDIPVDRKDPAAARPSFSGRSKPWRGASRSCSCPRARASRDGRVLRYQDGAFRLAIGRRRPHPASGDRRYRRGAPQARLAIRHADVRIHVFDPVETAGLGPGDVAVLRETVRQRTLSKLAEWRGVPVAEVDAAPEQRDVLAAPKASGAEPVAAPAARGERGQRRRPLAQRLSAPGRVVRFGRFARARPFAR